MTVTGHGAVWLCLGALLLAKGLSCFGFALVSQGPVDLAAARVRRASSRARQPAALDSAS